MSEEKKDDSQKTEDPTPKRREEARKKGQVVTSKEITHWFMVFGASMSVLVASTFYVPKFAQILLHFFERSDVISADAASLHVFYGRVIKEVGMVLLIPLGIMFAAAFIGNVIQNGLLFSTEPMKPKISKISLAKGVGRLFSMKGFVEFLKGILKIVAIGGGCYIITRKTIADPTFFIGMDGIQMLGAMKSQAGYIFVTVLSILILVAALDYFFQYFKHEKELRMTKQEVKEEHKQTEGDPAIKGKLRQIRAERARSRMMAEVPKATAVITNPTHFSVAIKYSSEDMTAPTVVAKGQDHIALKIREVAKEHDVPIMENPPLARALFSGVEIDQEIPEEHYKAVAEVIRYVMKVKRLTTI